jgi:tetratricopeptide (TPR) repeat protein
MSEADFPAPSDSALRRAGPSWRKKLLFSAGTCCLFLAALEIGLTLMGVRPYAEAVDPFLDFEPGVPLFVVQGDSFVTNPLKTTYFNEQSFSTVKPKNGYRIFCLGGSTTYGRPYRDAYSYVGLLRELLPRLDATRQWEVVNCGGISYSSYRLAALMEELARYQPDLIIFYEGHNEFLEERTYREIQQRWRVTSAALHGIRGLRLPTVLHKITHRAVKRTDAAVLSGEVSTILDNIGPEKYHRDDSLRNSVLDHFRSSVARICQAARRAHAGTILVSPASNLREFSPYKSEHFAISPSEKEEFESLVGRAKELLNEGDAQEARRLVEGALKIDSRFADAQFLAGKATLAAGDPDAALEHFVRARDEDVCPLRALSEIGPILAEVSGEQSAPFVDYPAIVAARTREKLGHDIPGFECFADHLHPTIELHMDLATALARSMQDMGVLKSVEDLPSASAEILAGRLKQITAAERADALSVLAQELTWAGKLDEAVEPAKRAAELAPRNAWIVCQYGRTLENQGKDDEALQAYWQAERADEGHSMPQFRLGCLLAKQGKVDEALEHLRRAVTTTPPEAPRNFQALVRVRYGDCLTMAGHKSAAAEQYRAAAKIDPGSELVAERMRGLASPKPSSPLHPTSPTVPNRDAGPAFQ